MARQDINYGTNPNDGTGDNLRVAMDKINDNFIEIVDRIGPEFFVADDPDNNDDEDNTLSVSYGNLVGVLIESIKELKTKILFSQAR